MMQRHIKCPSRCRKSREYIQTWFFLGVSFLFSSVSSVKFLVSQPFVGVFSCWDIGLMCVGSGLVATTTVHHQTGNELTSVIIEPTRQIRDFTVALKAAAPIAWPYGERSERFPLDDHWDGHALSQQITKHRVTLAPPVVALTLLRGRLPWITLVVPWRMPILAHCLSPTKPFDRNHYQSNDHQSLR